MKLNIKDKILLFDFDGTLVETEFLAKKVVEQYFAEKQVPQPLFFAEMIVGRTWKAATENMVSHAQHLGIALESADLLRTEFKKRYRDLFVTGVKLIPGLKECLPHFKAEAKFVGIVTGSERDEVATILKAHGLDDYFQRIWAFGDYKSSKPDPSPYLTAMRELNATVEETLVFEDSIAGMESAVRAGLSFVQITYEAHAKKKDMRALMVIDDWSQLL